MASIEHAKSFMRGTMNLNGLKWAAAIVATVSAMPFARASPIIIISPTSVTISISSALTVTSILDPVLVYQYSDGTSEHLGAVLLGAAIPTGATGPFLETISTPAGFVSGSATIFGLYANATDPGGCPPPGCGI